MKRVLVVEDEASIREMVALNLKMAGWEVVEAPSAERALELMHSGERCDAALLDIMLPGMDGFSVCHALRKALERFFPILRTVHLTDYKVRVLDSRERTASKVRVLIESTDGQESWTTVGVSVDIIEASLNALIDAIEYKLVHSSGREW